MYKRVREIRNWKNIFNRDRQQGFHNFRKYIKIHLTNLFLHHHEDNRDSSNTTDIHPHRARTLTPLLCIHPLTRASRRGAAEGKGVILFAQGHTAKQTNKQQYKTRHTPIRS